MKKSNHIVKSILSSGGEDILSVMWEISLEAVVRSKVIGGKIGYD